MLLLLASYGLCFGFMNDKVPFTEQVRSHFAFIERLLSCSYCTGFHCGWVLYALQQAWAGEMCDPLSLLVWGFASAAFCYAVETALSAIERVSS